MQKFVTFEKTFTKKEIESIMREHIEHTLETDDIDFRDARWCQDDFTFSFEKGEPSINVIVILDDVKFRKKWKTNIKNYTSGIAAEKSITRIDQTFFERLKTTKYKALLNY